MPSVEPKFFGKKKQYPESFDKMLRRFSRKCNKAGIVSEVKRRQYFEKPSEAKNAKNQKIKRKQKLAKFKAMNTGYRRR